MSGPIAGIELKVAASSATAVVTGALTWILVSYVHAFQHGLPPALANFLPYIVSAVLSAAAGWMAPHTPRQSAKQAQEQPAAHGNGQ